MKCTKCSVEKPETDFYRNKLKRGGFYSWCKACHLIITRRNHGRVTREEWLASVRQPYGYCTNCKQQKEPTDFHKDKRRPSGLAIHCKKCARARGREWWQKNKSNPEWLAARRAEYARHMRKRRQDPLSNLKSAARSMVSYAIRLGILVRQPCQDCGALKVEADHRNYAYPLRVRWVCRDCHDRLRYVPTVIEP